MTAALILSSSSPGAPPLAADLVSAGLDICGDSDCLNLLQDVIKKAPDIIVCYQESPNAQFFGSLAAVAASAPRPVAVFTLDPDAEKMASATRSGVHAYVVAGYSRNRLRSVIQLAQARFRHEQLLVQELADVRKQFDERKLVDRAKGILMGARQLREEEAFRALRSAAMATRRRIGEVAQVVIDSAHYAEAVNRAGQLRMLSQQIVKFYALACTGVTGAEWQGLLSDAIAQVGSNLAILERSLSKATFGDLLATVQEPWTRLQAVLRLKPTVARLHEVDEWAEQLLDRADTLTANLEVAAYAIALHVINVAGRQRMLSQRLAKEALIGSLEGARQTTGPGGGATLEEFLAGLDYLNRLPLSNADIAQELEATRLVWEDFRAVLAARPSDAGRARIAELSDVLLGHFERLTTLIERGVHALMGV
jgi:AmiR/NasT family two-component response regulator